MVEDTVKKINLNVLERISLMQILPTESSYLIMTLIKKLRDKLEFTEEEIKEFKILSNGAQIQWDKQSEKEVEFEFGPIVRNEIITKLKKLDEDKKLNSNLISLYEKFVE